MKKISTLILSLLMLMGTTHAAEATISQEEDQEVTPFQERRVDREINKKDFIFKGEIMAGVSASYNSLSTDNAEYLTLLTNVTVDGSILSVKPYAAYFYRDNRAVGARFGYMNYSGVVDSTTLDLGETNDLSFDIPYINMSSDSYSYAIFHRAYAPLDNKGHFGVFAEMELSATMGSTYFSYENDGEIKSTYSDNQSYDLSFNPGISAFVMHNICASLSFQFGGLNYTNIKQYDENGAQIGSRESSKMRFMFNVLAINFGITVHIW